MSRYRLLLAYASGALAALFAIGALAQGWRHREWTGTPESFDLPPISPGAPPIRVRRGADGKFYDASASPEVKPKPDLQSHADFVFYNVGGMYVEGRTFTILLGTMSALFAATAFFLLRRPRLGIQSK